MRGVISMEPAEIEQRKKELREFADIQSSQYAGRWAGIEWALVEILEDIYVNNDHLFWAGETTLAKPFKRNGKQSWCAYCYLSGKDEIIGLDKAVEVRVKK